MNEESLIEKTLIVKYRQHLNSPFNWETHSLLVVKHCPELFNKEKFNWKRYSYAILFYTPHLFDSELFNWEKHSHFIVKYRPELFDITKINLDNIHKNCENLENKSLKDIELLLKHK